MLNESGMDGPSMAGEGPLRPMEAEGRDLTLGGAIIMGLVMAVAAAALFGCIAAGVIH
jgi:hypothetical protein